MADQGAEFESGNNEPNRAHHATEFEPNCADTRAIADLLSNALKMDCICVIRRVRNRIIVRIFEPESEQEREWSAENMDDAMWV